MSTELRSRAPTRIDLAGGTVDIWPIYLFFNPSLTVNLGIDLYAETDLSAREGTGRVELVSEDQKHTLELRWEQILSDNEPQLPPQLVLHGKLLRHFAREAAHAGKKPSSQLDLKLTTRAKSPAGAGLGGSSTLAVSMVGALSQWARERAPDPARDGIALVELVRDIETTVIHVPAGVQDYFGAMYGDLQCLQWQPGGHLRRAYSAEARKGVEQRLLLFYSGQSRNSGINNWALFKNFIDRTGPTRDLFGRISAATGELDARLQSKDFAGAARAITSEWEARRQLATGITTPEIDRAFAAAKAIAPDATGKICGAGGGGCFFVFLPSGDAAERDRVREAVVQTGVRHLPFKAADHGLEVKRA